MRERILAGIMLVVILYPCIVLGIEKPGEELQEVGVKPILGGKTTQSLLFTDSSGSESTLQQISESRLPVIVVPAFFSCPRLCGLIHESVVQLLNDISLDLGKEYRVVTVSFDPRDTPQKAIEYADRYQAQYRTPLDAKGGWHFVVGQSGSERELMRELGFLYKRDGEEYAHSAAIFILTPQGEISQYFTGIDYDPFDVKLALVEAAKGAIGSPLDHILLYCFRFDDKQGRYTLVAYNAVRLGSGIGFLILVSVLFVLWRREVRMKREKGAKTILDV